MSFIPTTLLRHLYNHSSLKNTPDGVVFSIRNRLAKATIGRVLRFALNGQDLALDQIWIELPNGETVGLNEIQPVRSLEFPKDAFWRFHLKTGPLPEGSYQIEVELDSRPFGTLRLKVQDEIGGDTSTRIPRDDEDDYCEEIVRDRQTFVEQRCGVELQHIPHYSFDPHITRGNMEHFLGVTQVPLGIAGPLLVKGEHAKGEFYVPLAATEGTLVASYNRGMKLLNRCGGVKCAVVGDNMQRAPVFVFEDAAKARLFADWVVENQDRIRDAAEATDPYVKLKYIDYYLSNKFTYTRFNYTTGDAAGQNMVGKATFAACNWIMENYQGAKMERFYLESNLATDKKASMINTMRTRGKRVTAEAVLKRDVLREVMGADTVALFHHSLVANVGSMMSGCVNNGLHSANAVTAIFLATGQDVADVSESSAALVYTELNDEKDLYISITLPSLIVATRGGGTGLATQREALKIMGCDGVGKVRKLAEIIAGTVLAGEVSLACAISTDEWVSSHDEMGRNPD